MATHAHSTRTPLLPPVGAQPPLSPRGAGRQFGPVTAAIRAMRAGIPETERQRVRALRRRIADRIEADIALLDMLAGDAELEPELGSPEVSPLDRLGGSWSDRGTDQTDWARGATDDREQENEHGGDINDEPHDDEEDDDRDSGCADREGAIEQFGDLARHAAVFA